MCNLHESNSPPPSPPAPPSPIRPRRAPPTRRRPGVGLGRREVDPLEPKNDISRRTDRPTDDRPTDRSTDRPTTDRLIDDSSGGLIVCLLLVCASLKECASRLLFNVLRQGKQPTDRPTDRSTDNRPTDRGVVVIVIASHFGSSISQA